MVWICAVVSSVFLFTTIVRSLPPATNIAGNTTRDKMVISGVNNIDLTEDNVVCINSTKGAAMPDTGDCMKIIQQFVSSPKYRMNQIWVGHGRRAEPDQVQTPAGNRNGTCLIAVHAENPLKTDAFKIRDVAIKAQIIMASCYPRPGMLKYGGIAPVGNGRSFVVSVEPKEGIDTGGTTRLPLR